MTFSIVVARLIIAIIFNTVNNNVKFRGGENVDVQQQIKKSGVRQWKVAEALGVTEFTFSRWMRRPEKLPLSTIEKIQVAIKKLSGKGE